jgi:hypothetical protein
MGFYWNATHPLVVRLPNGINAGSKEGRNYGSQD